MNRQLIEDLHLYFEQKVNPTHEENYLQARLTGELPYFPISSICRDDLEGKGFDVSKVTDSQMSALAGKLCNDYSEQLFWSSMEILAEEYSEIPKYICPKCGKKDSQYDSNEKVFQCYSCQNIWKKEDPTGNYVLVKFPQDTSFYEDNDIGYPCSNCEDNEAIYVPEHFYRQHTGDESEVNTMFRPVMWPASQKYMDLQPESMAALCEPIRTDAKSIEAFGDMSIWVPLCLIEEQDQGNLKTQNQKL